jgi:hypothetical protein
MSSSWEVIAADFKVPAKPAGIWTMAVDWINGPAVVKIEANDDEWYYSEADSGKTRADGHLMSLLSCKACIHPAAPVGALIAKIGGSSAGVSDGTLYTIGKFALIEIDKPKGPLFLTINDELSGLENNRGSIKVSVSARALTAAAATGTGAGPSK